MLRRTPMVIPLRKRSKSELLINSNHRTAKAKTPTPPTSQEVRTSQKRKSNYSMRTPTPGTSSLCWDEASRRRKGLVQAILIQQPGHTCVGPHRHAGPQSSATNSRSTPGPASEVEGEEDEWGEEPSSQRRGRPAALSRLYPRDILPDWLANPVLI